MCTQRVCKKRRLSWPGWLLSLGQRKNNRRAAWKWSVRNNNSRQIEYSVEEKGTLEYTIVLRIEISFPDTYRVFWICIDKHPFSRLNYVITRYFGCFPRFYYEFLGIWLSLYDCVIRWQSALVIVFQNALTEFFCGHDSVTSVVSDFILFSSSNIAFFLFYNIFLGYYYFGTYSFPKRPKNCRSTRLM